MKRPSQADLYWSPLMLLRPLLLILVFASTLVGGMPSATAATCTPQDRSSTLSDITLADNTVGGYQIVQVDFRGELPNGSCAGDTVTIDVPPELSTQNGAFDVRDPDGVLMGTMVVHGGIVTITFNEYVENHTGVSYHGFLNVAISGELHPGTHYDLTWSVGAEAVVTPIDTNPCPGCSDPNPNPSKWAAVSGTKVVFGLQSAVTRTQGEVVTFTDRVGPGQAIDCGSLAGFTATGRSAWGSLTGTTPSPFAVVSCDATALTVRMVAPSAGVYLLLNGSSTITRDLTHYSDIGTIEQAGRTVDVPADAPVFAGGAGGDGSTPLPRIDIEKWSTADGEEAGDFDSTGKPLDPTRPEKLTFTVTNTGTEVLTLIKVSDKTVAGNATVGALTCDFTPLQGPPTGTAFAGPFAPGESFTCTATLAPLGDGATHTDTATVTAVGETSKKTVDDSDDWNAATPKAEIEPPKVQVSPPAATPAPQPDVLPDTGVSGSTLLGLLAGLLLLAGGTMLVRRSAKE